MDNEIQLISDGDGLAVIGVAGGFGQDVAVGELKSEIQMTKPEFVHNLALSAAAMR